MKKAFLQSIHLVERILKGGKNEKHKTMAEMDLFM